MFKNKIDFTYILYIRVYTYINKIFYMCFNKFIVFNFCNFILSDNLKCIYILI